MKKKVIEIGICLVFIIPISIVNYTGITYDFLDGTLNTPTKISLAMFYNSMCKQIISFIFGWLTAILITSITKMSISKKCAKILILIGFVLLIPPLYWLLRAQPTIVGSYLVHHFTSVFNPVGYSQGIQSICLTCISAMLLFIGFRTNKEE